MKKDFKITSLTAAALAALILSSVNLDNNVKADNVTGKTTTSEKSQSPEDQAKANVSSAQKDVDTAQKDVDSSKADLDKAKSDAVEPNKAYDDQAAKTKEANENAANKKNALDAANKKQSAAQKLADEATPDAINKARQDVADKNSEIAQKQQDVKDAQAKTSDAQKNVDNANADVNAKNDALIKAKNAKSDADQKVVDAENALNHTNFEQVKNNLKKANTDVEQDAKDLESVANKIKNSRTNVITTKDAIKAVKNAADNASNDKNQAQTDYDAKKSASDKVQHDIAKKNQDLTDLQNKLRYLNDLNNEQNKNNIIIKNLSAYKQAYADYMNGKLTDEDKAYLDSAINDNKYVSSDKAAQEKIDPNNLTKEQIKELSLFTVHLFNQLRKQVGLTPNDIVTEGAIDFAKKVTAAYREDKWSFADHNNHDCKAINKISDESGLKSYADMFGEKPGDENYDSYNEYAQPYEDAFTADNFDDSYRNNPYLTIEEPNGMEGTSFAPQTMDDLRRYVFIAANSMIFGSGNQYEFDHARGILGAVDNSPEIVAENNKEDLQDKINDVKVTLSTDEDAIPGEEPGESLVKALKNAESNKSIYEKYLRENPQLANYYQKLINENNQVIARLPKQIEEKKKELQQLEEIAKRDTSYPHYVATDFVSGIPHSPKENDNTTSETQVHFLNGMNPSTINDPSKFSTKEVPSYEKQAANVQNKITEIQHSLSQLKAQAKSLNDATTAAKDALDKAKADLTVKQNDLNVANNNYQAAQNALSEAIQEEKNLQAKQTQDLAKQKRAQEIFDVFQGDHEQLVARYKSAVSNQKVAESAVHDATKALSDAETNLANAQKAQSDLKEDIANKQKLVEKAQGELTSLQARQSQLEGAHQALENAKQAAQQAQNEYDAAKNAATDAKTQLDALKTAKDTADAKVKTAQDKYDQAKAKLSDAQAKLAHAKQVLYDLEHPAIYVDNSSEEKPTEEVVKTSTNGNEGEEATPVIKKSTSVKIEFIHNSYVYAINGKIVKRHGKRYLIRKGHKAVALNNAKIVKINGKKFYQIAKNEYVKVVNTMTEARKINVRAIIKGRKNQKVRTYSSVGKFSHHYVYGKRSYKFTSKKNIKGKTYYKLSGKDEWVLASKLIWKN